MSIAEAKDIREEKIAVSSADVCRNVADLYNSGKNCDLAVFLALQNLSMLKKETWDFTDLYCDKPDDTERFLCKVLAAGAVAIYLDIITRRVMETGTGDVKTPEPIERVNRLMSMLLAETAAGRHDKLATFDPFQQDTYLRKELVTQEMRSEYKQKATRLFNNFQQTFNCRDCVDVLGFDPFSYELYDEEIQEQIESGEWMQKCVHCMQHIITTFIERQKDPL